MEKTNRKISLIITIVFIVSLFIGVILLTYSKYLKNNNIYEEENNNKPTIISKDISMNLEQTAGVGDYKTVTQSNWPTEGYKFNAELSRCENGSELSWDDTKKVVVVSGNLSDKCYVYFDKLLSLTEYVISQYTGTQGENGIYYHDSSLTNGAGDNSYRYAGPSESVNNFVCFGSDATTCPTDNLYRILGVFGENYHGVSGKQLVKLIKYDYNTKAQLGEDGDYKGSYTPSDYYVDGTYKGSQTTLDVYYWNNDTQTNIWSTSLLNKTNLNTNFINNIGSTWSNKIATTTWKVGGNTWANIGSKTPSVAYTNEITNPDPTKSTDNATEYSAKIGLMYVSDYGLAASPEAWTLTISSYNNTTATNNNWVYMGNNNEWTISRYADYSNSAFFVFRDGRVAGFMDGTDYGDVSYYYGVRVTFNLEPSVTYVSGTGTSSDPIILS